MDRTLPKIPVSIGELLDKWVIIQIKASRIKDETKLDHIMTELEILSDIVSPYVYGHEYLPLQGLITELTEVNEKLWNIEDDIRELEHQGVPLELIKIFNTCSELADCINIDKMQRFVELAREVYITNDKRCAVKRRINELLLSGFLEEKSYTEY